ncbi:hypothetical protein [Staphylococcus agnetis]|uniref:hypothetical protein n=1 Tax=Staphylococcus agnetis TaxID=985762 RepID=UPI0013007608|nr:hypothetical protein [Staphylococcus agnetis]
MIPKFRVFHNENMRDVKSIDWSHKEVWLATVYGTQEFQNLLHDLRRVHDDDPKQ